jgi:HSP20 family molecular chaperone IbpA
MSLKTYLSIFSFVVLAFFPRPSLAQAISEPLQSFDKVQVSPLINLVLNEGEEEHIRIEYSGIAPEKINFSVKGKKLRIYLDDAKYTVKTEEIVKDGYRQNVPIYRNVKVTAYVSYKNLKNIQVRGEESVTCNDSLTSKKFKISLFGESSVNLAFLQTRRLKIQAFGENELTIRAGDSEVQKVRLFGENKIHTENMYAARISSSFFGESSMDLYAGEEIRMWGIGEVKLSYSGQAYLKKFIIGESSITQW